MTKEKGDVNLFAVVRIRGIRNMKPLIKKTFEHLRLNKPNHCVLLQSTPLNLGMLERIKDYVTFGKISGDMLVALLLKRGKCNGRCLRALKNEEEIKRIASDIVAGKNLYSIVDPVFRLHPPRKGYKNLKLHFPLGDLGYRELIDDFLKRMI